ncbi:helix-turn-helix transcriptional regulator [Thermosynechococcus sp. FA-CM-4201]
MSRHLERLLKLDECLRTRTNQRWTATALGEKLEVSERTVRNDIAFLRDRYHAPIEFSKTRGYHYTDSSWRLPSIPLTGGELFALTLGARMLETYSGSAYASQLRSAIQRLAERLPQNYWVDLQQVANERIIFWRGAETQLDPLIWQNLEIACKNSQSVKIRYYTASRNAESERIVDPYLLHIYRATNPYLIGYCHTRKEIRWFRVDRIKVLQILEQTFERDPSFEAKTYLEQIFQYEAGGIPEKVKIWFDAQTAPYIRERRWHSTQQIEEHSDQSLTLVMEVAGLNDLKRWILGYGKGAKVLEPPKLVAMITEELLSMQQYYPCH